MISDFRNFVQRGKTMFYECLENLCRQKQETVSSVVKALGLSTSKVTAWKNGSSPNGIILTKLADYLECSVDTLLERTTHNGYTIDDKYEKMVIDQFRTLSDQGKEYILQTLAMAVNQYKKDITSEYNERQVN